METKEEKDSSMETILNNLETWVNADAANHSCILMAVSESGFQSMLYCSMTEMIAMMGVLTLNRPQFALAIKRVAGIIDRLMQSETNYQKLKDFKDLSENAKNELFMKYFKQAVEKKHEPLAEFLSKSRDIDSDDNAYNDEE